MKNEKLFEAIGNLDEDMLAETEAVTEIRTRKIGWKAALVAAVVAGLAVTAAAAPMIRNALKGGTLEPETQAGVMPTDPITGESPAFVWHEIMLDVEFNEDAPRSIETYYMIPEIPAEFTHQDLGHIYMDAMEAWFGWRVPGTDRDIRFIQWAGNNDRIEDVLTVNVTTAPGETPVHGLRIFAGIQGYLVEEPTLGDNYGEREFYWSDGDYLFCLQVPCDYTDAQLEAMVASVQPMEDITPYLATMTEEEIAGVFG